MEVSRPTTTPASKMMVRMKASNALWVVRALQKAFEIVTPLPDLHDFAAIKTDEVMKMLESWNPSLRESAAKALADRGTAVVPDLLKGTKSENDKVRAGSATALASICKTLPPEEQPAGVVESFMRLMKDGVLEVRVASLQAIGAVAPQTKEATLAVLALCNDPDPYLAQDAKLTLDKRFQAHTLPIEETEADLKGALGGPLPRGRGHIVKIIGRLKPMDQRRFIPELLAHLDWYARRDTMFAGGGQEEALRLLTKLEVPELVPRLPKLMGKKGRGMHLYAPSIESARAFGAMSKPLYNDLKKIYKDMEKLGKDAPITPDSRGDFKEGMDDLKRLLLELEAY